MSITISRIAELAGVSRATVDRVLKKRGGVNTQTAERIQNIIYKYDYKPNLIGKALVHSNKAINIGVILNDVGNRFFDEVKLGMRSALCDYSDFGLKMHLQELKGYDVDEQLNAIDKVLEEGMHALIITPIDDIKIARKIDILVANDIKVIAVNSDLTNSNRLAYVGCDYYKSGLIAGGLIELLTSEKAKVGILTGSFKVLGHKLRVRGIQDTITKLEHKGIEIAQIIECDDDNEKSYQATKTMLENDSLMDFIYITAGGVSGVCRAISNLKMNHIKVATFDDTEEIRILINNGQILATICQQPYEQGYKAIKLVYRTCIAEEQVMDINHTELTIKIKESI